MRPTAMHPTTMHPTTMHPTAAPGPLHGTRIHLPHQPPVSIHLPLDFTAFCELRYAHYQRHARLRLTDPAAADHAVQNALGALATDWRRVLGSPRPAYRAWQILTGSITALARRYPDAPPTAARTLYTLLPAPRADAMLLHLQGLSLHEAAEVTGLDEPVLAYRLRAAQHTLDARLAPQANPNRKPPM
ncbi:hypothetical protein [Streptomyces sp. MST-110588]|uniref:hypothetical protein n=1 Tax=Streptomyces sp. MST-110588 TaxID=2833628 RepID=UPI001F5E1F83|nr:hypothetical protein [Streptomyces sp. MST-110588]UNO43567.1 hypothetical protein KGS77_33930 [Streptomyces sp. MST-110588]